MSLRQSVIRFVVGLAVVAVALVAAFAVALPAIHRWGTTETELVRAMPGDEILPRADVAWTHAMTIKAAPEQVWPWIAQIGDERGGFYSYTFVENLVVAALNDPSYNLTYRNTNRIVPEWQRPQPGDSFIRGLLRIRAVEPGRWLVAEPSSQGLGWSWVWLLEPQQNGAQTRLLIRMRVGAPGGAPTPALANFLLDVGGFMMEQKMMQGIALRAEGGSEPAYGQALEIMLWLSTLTIGLIAGWLFMRRRAWHWPLAVGVAAVLALVVLTIVQPPIWVRLVIDIVLIAGLWRAGRHDTLPEQRMSGMLKHAAS